MELLKEVVFVILMQNHDGIVGKAPSYLVEKREAVDSFPTGDMAAKCLLDSSNMAIYEQYKKMWRV